MTRKLTLPVRVFSVVVLLFSSALIVMSQNPEKVLYSFTGGADGAQPHQGTDLRSSWQSLWHNI